MAVSVSSFLEAFPEFSGERAATDLIQAKIAEASRSVDSRRWGARTDDGVAYLAAHLLAMSPWGQKARLSDGNTGTTTYKGRFDEMRRQVGIGGLVLR